MTIGSSYRSECDLIKPHGSTPLLHRCLRNPLGRIGASRAYRSDACTERRPGRSWVVGGPPAVGRRSQVFTPFVGGDPAAPALSARWCHTCDRVCLLDPVRPPSQSRMLADKTTASARCLSPCGGVVSMDSVSRGRSIASRRYPYASRVSTTAKDRVCRPCSIPEP
jgi:hypothetical protein